MARGPNWQQIEQIFPIGSIQTGKIFHHAPFGVFLDIGGGDYLGIIQITDFLDEGRMTPELYPVLGSEVVQFSGTVNLSGFYNAHFQIVQGFCIPATNAFLSDYTGSPVRYISM